MLSGLSGGWWSCQIRSPTVGSVAAASRIARFNAAVRAAIPLVWVTTRARRWCEADKRSSSDDRRAPPSALRLRTRRRRGRPWSSRRCHAPRRPPAHQTRSVLPPCDRIASRCGRSARRSDNLLTQHPTGRLDRVALASHGVDEPMISGSGEGNRRGLLNRVVFLESAGLRLQHLDHSQHLRRGTGALAAVDLGLDRPATHRLLVNAELLGHHRRSNCQRGVLAAGVLDQPQARALSSSESRLSHAAVLGRPNAQLSRDLTKKTVPFLLGARDIPDHTRLK